MNTLDNATVHFLDSTTNEAPVQVTGKILARYGKVDSIVIKPRVVVVRGGQGQVILILRPGSASGNAGFLWSPYYYYYAVLLLFLLLLLLLLLLSIARLSCPLSPVRLFVRSISSDSCQLF